MYPRQDPITCSVPTSFSQEGPDSIQAYFEKSLAYGSHQVILELLNKEPSLAKISYWQGMTALHKSCLRADDMGLEVVRALLSRGADVHATTVPGETPVMFACKRGNIRLIQLIISAGGDLAVRDRLGRGVIHHACLGGSVAAVHFLRMIYGMPLEDRDSKGVTPLHVVCSQSSSDLLQYLLRNGANVRATDDKGNTPLHYAAKIEHLTAVWALVERGGIGLVDATNSEGHTPLALSILPPPPGAPPRIRRPGHEGVSILLQHSEKQLSSTRKSSGGVAMRRQSRVVPDKGREESTHIDQQNVERLLNEHSCDPEPVVPPSGPGPAWYIHLLTAPALHLAFLLCACTVRAFLPTWPIIGSLIAFVGLGYTGSTISRHSHRMSHACGWPNPAFAGAFGAGLVGTLICFLVVIVPQRGVMSCLDSAFIVCVAAPVSLWMYYKLLTGDPGYVIINTSEDVSHEALLDIAAGRIPQSAFCATCEIITPPGSKHCRLCMRCIKDMDHHCLFLLICVGGENHVRFIKFIALILAAMVTFLYSAWAYTVSTVAPVSKVLLNDTTAAAATTTEFISAVSGLFDWLFISGNLFLVTMCLLNVISFAWGLSLLRWQLEMASRGIQYATSRGHYKALSGPISLSTRLGNVWRFFRGRTGRSSSSVL